jgi:hypothetical protein
LLAVFGPGLDPQLDGAIERWHRDIRAKHGLPRRDVEVMIEVRPLAAEVRVDGVADAQKQIAGQGVP